MQNSTSSNTLKQIQTALHAAQGLTLLYNVLEDTAGQSMQRLLTALIAPEPDGQAIARAFSHTFRALANAVNEKTVPQLNDAWQAHLIARIIDDSNAWSMQAERSNSVGISEQIRKQAQRDLRTLQLFYNLSADLLWQITNELVAPTYPALQDAWVPWLDLAAEQVVDEQTGRGALSKRIAQSDDWAELATILETYWARHGTGPLARYHFLRWHGVEAGLSGVEYPDPIRLTDLVGYTQEKAHLCLNTERFLAGLPAQDVLLYGAPGTGKSSMVKALVNTYAEQGLCLVEVHKEQIGDLLTIVALLRQRAPHFIVFIDDLSFEEQETEYKVLKVLLEGTAEARPSNVLIYATTNRWNLVRENFTDRGKQNEDVHWRDTMEEKQSLVHRFGLRITFITPDQALYLTIVEGLAEKHQMKLPVDELRERALRWEHQHVGRSGRVARQFINDLEAELKKPE